MDRYVARIALTGNDSIGALQLTRQDKDLPRLQNDTLILDILATHAREIGDKTAFVFIDQSGEETALSYADLLKRVGRYSNWISQSVKPGDRVLLALESGENYVTSFLGALAAGTVPVPVFPPEKNRQNHQTRLQSVITDADPALIITETSACGSLQSMTEVQIATPEDCPESHTPFTPAACQAGDLAFLQYTSGSTSRPKGVMVSHGNIVANAHAMIVSTELSSQDICVSWLPIYHDMGLIGNVLMPLVAGMTTVNMSPKRFLMRPERWLQAITKHRGTVSGAPDFAYRLCAAAIRDKTLTGLDLSTWRVAFSGSEAVRESTLDQFSDRFSAVGFTRKAFLPCYGLAEATLAVTCIASDATPTTVSSPTTDKTYVNCGKPVIDTDIRIGEAAFQFSNAGPVGEVYVSAPGIALGYWQKPDATADAFRMIDGKRWLRTGDLGFLAEGELVITGRVKDLIILDGQNIYPADIEAHLEQTAAVARNGRVAAFATQADDGEGYGVALELAKTDLKATDLDALAGQIAMGLADTFQHAPDTVVFVAPRSLPRTSSGKLQRGLVAKLAMDQPDQILHQFARKAAVPARLLTADESALASLWSVALGHEISNPDAHFFLEGGSSVQAVRLLAQIEAEYDVTLPLGALFAAPTLTGMVKTIQEAAPRLVVPAAHSNTFAITGLSSYFWFLDCFGFGGVCHVACGLRFSGGLGVDVLERALRAVVVRQEALRLRFARRDDGGLSATVVPAEMAQIGVRQVDFSGLSPQVAAARLDNLSAQDAGDRIDLLTSHGWRATLVHLPDGEQALLLTLHHILCDGWSMGVLQADLLAALAGQLAADPLTPGYLDVQHWQAALAAGGAHDADLAWWQAQFADEAPAPLELPLDRARPAQRSWRGGRVAQEIPAAVADRLRHLAQGRGATLQQVLMAGWAALLHRLSAATDLCIGLPVAGRDRAELQQMVGLFVNTLPLRITVDPGTGFAGLVDHLRDQAGAALAHQGVALDVLTQRLRGDQSAAAKPLFDVVHAHQPTGFDRITLPGGQQATPFARATGAQQFDLALETVEAATGPIPAALGYDADLFLEETAQRCLQAYLDLLQHMVTLPDQPLDLVPLISAADQARLAGPWPDSQAPDSQADVPALVPARIAAQDPARTAIIFAGEETSYAALNARANQVAHALLQRALPPEARVAICLPRGPGAIAACLGVMRAGAAFVPLDPGHPTDRRSHILQDCAAALIITDDPADIPVLTQAEIAQYKTDLPDIRLDPDQLAYVIYTSGSTGTPKGVAVPHGPLAMHIATTAAAYEMGPDCRELHMLSLAFDGAHERWMVPCWLGGAVVMRPDTLWSGDETLAALADHGISNAGFPTAMFHQVAEAARGTTPPPVQMYSFGGEAMPRASFDLAAKSLQPALMINGYGPTECVISPMIWKARPGSDAARFDAPNAPIGRPVGARRAYVLDARLRPVLPGQPGELYLAGGLARGYLNRPGQTAQVFLPDPFGAPGSRMYRTGDRVRQRPDGVIDYLGRADRQIKLRGYRIEPGEIEARLSAMEDVRQAHVARVNTETGPLLAAWVTPASGAAPQESTLQQRLRSDLPGYMVPSRIEIIPHFPQTPNGKTDTKALTLTPRKETPDTTEPLTKLETHIAQIWENITKQKPNKSTNFFNQNNNSITAMQMVTRMRQAGFDIALRDFFAAQTLEAIAAAAKPAINPSVQAPTGPAALTPIQKWFLERDDPTPDHWNQYICIHVASHLTADLIADALQQVIRRHEVFRTSFHRAEQGWQGHVQAAPKPFQLVRCFDQDIATYLARAHDSLSLENGDLFRAIWTESASNHLYLIAHHMIVDGVSWRVILHDLERVLAGNDVMPGGSPSLWAAEVAGLDIPAAKSAAWTDQTALIKDLPVDDPDADNKAGDLVHHLQVLGTDLTKAAKTAGQKPYGADLQALLLSALAQALWTWTGERDNVVAVERHGRMGIMPAPDRAVGWFTAVAPVTVSAGSDRDCICQTKDALALSADIAPSYNTWRFETGAKGALLAFNHLGEEENQESPFSVDMSRSGLSMGPASPVETDITLLSYIRDDQLHLDWEYAGQRLTEETIRRLATHLSHALSGLVAHCETAPKRATRSDYPLADIAQETLDRIEPPARGITDIYPVTPLQAGMLFHADLNPTDDIYVNQMQITLSSISAMDFRRAWITACKRHTIFRTGFEAVGASGEYMQLLHDEAPHEVRVLQNGMLDIDALCKEDRDAGFDLAKPPLSRLTIVEGGSDTIHLIWTCHHLLTDGWSLGTLLGEVLALAERPDIALPSARPFKDHIAALATRPFDKDVWARRLADLEAPTRISEAFSAAEAPAADLSLSLPKSLITALDQRASTLGITLNTLFQAALALTMRRFQHESTLCFGVTTAGRHDMPADQPAVGLYISTLPFVCTLVDQDMDDWLRDLQQQGVDLLNHEGDGLNAIAEQAPQKGGELFDTLFVFENYPLDAVLHRGGTGTGIMVQDYTLEERTNYPLTVSVIPHDDMMLKLASSAGSFGKDGLVSIAETMVAALKAVAVSGGKSLHDVRRMLGSDPVFKLYNDEPASTLTARFAEVVTRQPDAFAIRDGDIRLTYQQLDHQANALAHRIIDAGAKDAERIGLACDRSAHLIIGMLAILKTGKAYVPLDPANPAERLRYIVEDAGLRHIVTDQHLPETIEGAISVDDLQSCGQPPVATQGQAAYVIYTSGSTGQAKGVEVTHANVLHLLGNNRYDFDSRDVWAAFHAYSFDFSVWEIFGALISGGEVVMVPYLTSRDPKAMSALLRDCGVSIFCQTPTAFHQILPELLNEPASVYRLRHLFLGAEVIDLSSLDPVWTQFKDIQVHNLYGPTEATVFVTQHTLSPSDVKTRKNAPLGKATPDTALFLLDDLGQEVPDGVPGELFVAGPAVANGYVNKTDLNDLAFPTRQGCRLYKTGDLLKRGPDGLFEFCGRADQQIKLRGFRIELGEVEAALRAVQGINDAAVIVHQSDLAGYYVGEPDADIKSALAARLPNHMMPRWLIGLPALPMTPNGKLDRRALPQPIDQKRVGHQPTTPTETTLAQIWRDILGVENVFADDDFFALGGHSLLVTRLRTKIEQEFDLTIPLKTLFEDRRLSQIATHIDQTKTTDDDFDDLTALMDELET